MRGRILGVKKTTIVSFSFYLTFLFIISSTLLTTLLLKNYFLWFFFLCLFCGTHLLIKAVLFRVDSSCYFGFLLFFIGISGILDSFLHITFVSALYIFSFALASFLTFCFFKEFFQFYLGLALFIIGLAWFFYKIYLLPLWIFLAILTACVLLFVIRELVTKRS